MEGHCDVVKCLLSSGADINLRDDDGQLPLFVASKEGHFDVVKCNQISAPKLRKHLTTSQCPFADATNNGDCPFPSHKLTSASELSKGQSPFVASMYAQCDVVKCLLSSGADINLCDKQGQSPLFVASMCEHCDVVKCLLSSGASMCEHCDVHCPYIDATNGDCPSSSHKLTSASELHVSKHLTTFICPYSDTQW
jgi:ankyrin repeat protein